jgi:hypothetical protein
MNVKTTTMDGSAFHYSIRFRILLLLSFCYLCVTSAKAQFHPVPAMTIDASLYHEQFKELKVKPFSISNLITVQEFKIYLDAVKKDSSATFYKSQLPKSREMKEDLVQAILSSPELQNKPMPGVSWTVARNYCLWLSQKSKSMGLNHEFDLPYVSEVMAFNQLYKSDECNDLETWTLNSYDESIFEILKIFDYTYIAKESDPSALKRKVIFDGSYHMNYVPKSTFQYLQYEYQDSSSRFVGFRVVRRYGNSSPQKISLNSGDIKFNLENNKLEGIYQENYASGKVKVLGTFSKGQRVGVWSIWDENGVMKIQRDYKNNQDCTFLFPLKNHVYSEVYAKHPAYVLQRNSEHFYPYQFVEERSVAFSMRLWRQLSTDNEPELFHQLNIEKLIPQLFANEAKWYQYGTYGDFKTEVSNDSLMSLKEGSQLWDKSRIEVKEDFYFNADNLRGDTRAISISFYKNKTDVTPSYTVYYPHIRAVLAQFKAKVEGVSEIENIDDVFFFNAYRGTIVHRSGLDEKTKTKEIDLQIELEKFSSEHDLWLSFQR